jgi:peptide/nickel transport system permease protein
MAVTSTSTVSWRPSWLAVAKNRMPLVMAVRRFALQPAGFVGLSILLLVVLLAVFAPSVAPYSPIEQFPGSELRPPSPRFLLGTDNIGRDLLSRIIFGTRVSLLVGVLAVSIGSGVGGSGGLLAGYAGGLTDAVIMRVSDAVFAVPAVLLGIALAAAFGASSTIVAITVGIATVPTFARLTRASVLSERPKEYVFAARTVGASPLRLIARHVLPNVLGLLLVQMALTMAAAVLLEAGLSFLGLGTQPPQPSWGVMLSESRQYLRQAPWYGLFPGVAVTLLVLALNSLADALRDAIDPRGGAPGSRLTS